MLAVGAVPLPWKTTHWCSINTTSRVIIWSFPICKFIPAFLTSFKTSVHQHDNLAFTANCSILLLLHFFMDFCCPVWQVPMLYFHLLGFFFWLVPYISLQHQPLIHWVLFVFHPLNVFLPTCSVVFVFSPHFHFTISDIISSLNNLSFFHLWEGKKAFLVSPFKHLDPFLFWLSLAVVPYPQSVKFAILLLQVFSVSYLSLLCSFILGASYVQSCFSEPGAKTLSKACLRLFFCHILLFCPTVTCGIHFFFFFLL